MTSLHGDLITFDSCFVKEAFALETHGSTNESVVTVPANQPFVHIIMDEVENSSQEVTINLEKPCKYLLSSGHGDATITPQTFDVIRVSATQFKVIRTATSGNLTDKGHLRILIINDV
jgi:hypothetical protein